MTVQKQTNKQTANDQNKNKTKKGKKKEKRTERKRKRDMFKMYILCNMILSVQIFGPTSLSWNMWNRTRPQKCKHVRPIIFEKCGEVHKQNCLLIKGDMPLIMNLHISCILFILPFLMW